MDDQTDPWDELAAESARRHRDEPEPPLHAGLFTDAMFIYHEVREQPPSEERTAEVQLGTFKAVLAIYHLLSQRR